MILREVNITESRKGWRCRQREVGKTDGKRIWCCRQTGWQDKLKKRLVIKTEDENDDADGRRG